MHQNYFSPQHLLLAFHRMYLASNSLQKLPPFIKGFVEVISPVTLSVTGVYTAEFCVPSPTQACAPGPVSIDVVPEEPFAGP